MMPLLNKDHLKILCYPYQQILEDPAEIIDKYIFKRMVLLMVSLDTIVVLSLNFIYVPAPGNPPTAPAAPQAEFLHELGTQHIVGQLAHEVAAGGPQP